MIEFNLATASAPGESPPAVSIIGIGGAGANVLDHIALEGMDGVELTGMNCDARSLHSSMAQRKVQLGKTLTQGLGCGGDPELGEEAARTSEDEIREALTGRRMIFLCVGLGGGTGSGAAPVIARLARETGAFVIVFATLPFSFEGKRRMAQARAALDEIRGSANALVCFENDKMGELVLPKKGVTEAFEVADRIICQSVRAVTTVATQPGIIRIGMDDLIAALRNADSRCLFGFGQAKGEARATEALQAALKSPLLDRGQLLEKARNVLVHICGGNSLTLFEIETLMRDLSKHVNEDAQILFGAACDPALADTLSVTIISSLGTENTALPSAAAEKLPAAPPRGPVPVTPIISPPTHSVPILSVQPRQAPPSPRSGLPDPGVETVTGVASEAPALQFQARLVPEPVAGRPAKPVRPAPLSAPEPEFFEEPETSATMDNGFAAAAVAGRNGTSVTPAADESITEEESTEVPVFADESAGDEEIVRADEEDIEQWAEPGEIVESSVVAEMADPSEEALETSGEEEWTESAPVPMAYAETNGSEREVSMEAEEPVEEDYETTVGADADTVAPHPAFDPERTQTPMRPMPSPQPAARPAARKFDLREILQRQRQARFGAHRAAPPAAPQSSAPPAPARREIERTPNPDRVAPIRPIPAARGTGPLTPGRPGRVPAPAPPAKGRPREQATFDEHLAPAGKSGRFEKVEPTVEEGEDLDVPTFLRKKR